MNPDTNFTSVRTEERSLPPKMNIKNIWANVVVQRSAKTRAAVGAQLSAVETDSTNEVNSAEGQRPSAEELQVTGGWRHPWSCGVLCARNGIITRRKITTSRRARERRRDVGRTVPREWEKGVWHRIEPAQPYMIKEQNSTLKMLERGKSKA